MSVDDTQVTAVAQALAAARRVVVLTGAGVSAASGVPTFRGADGLWRHYRPEDLATPEAFARNPQLVWEWYDWRRQRIAACAPNGAHRVLAAWAGRFPAYTLVTQNVDGLHEQAGTPGVLRLHGSIWQLRCADGCAKGRRGREDRTAPLTMLPPRCPHCGGLERPGVVWFGESLDPGVLARAVSGAGACDLFLAVGTSAVVHPAAGLIGQAARARAVVVEVNPEATPYADAVHVTVRAPAEQFLPRVDAALGRAGAA